MRPSSARLWSELVSDYERLHLYTVDPGAHAIARELVPLVKSLGRFGSWFADGWSAAQEHTCRPAVELMQALAPQDGLLVCSQTNFARTQAVLTSAAAGGATTIFVFDHWKNFAEHFGSGPMPNVIVVPDEIARELAVAALGADAAPRIRVLPHLGVEAAADRILASGVPTRPGVIAMLLDPTEAADGLGYDWRSVLALALRQSSARPGRRILVRPHPRQDARAVARELAILRHAGVEADIFTGDTEYLIAIAEEVWGMTTIALNAALAIGKPIRSFQNGRNAVGVRASNPHIEPFVVA